MKKSYIIMGILICIIAFLGYLQYGHEEQAVNTMVSTSGAFYKQEFDVIANKPNEMIISVYNTEWHYQYNCMALQIVYTSDDGKLEIKNCGE